MNDEWVEWWFVNKEVEKRLVVVVVVLEEHADYYFRFDQFSTGKLAEARALCSIFDGFGIFKLKIPVGDVLLF